MKNLWTKLQIQCYTESFAFLTGRSLSAFKRDIKETPNRWLVQKRLQEALFIEKENKEPSEIYLDLSFKTLSHFSFAFEKQFGLTPTELTERKKKTNG